MRYTVIWTPTALNVLAAIWNQAEDRNAVTAASNEMDRVLAAAPREQGESRKGNVRVMFANPLGVEYEVIEDDLKVEVLAVWRIA
jgi:hypothetical protein